MMRTLLKLLRLFRTPEMTEAEYHRLVARSRQRCPLTGRFLRGGVA